MAKRNENYVLEAVTLLGGLTAAGRVCGVHYTTVRQWVKAGKPPRTEATGETRYAELMAAADPRISKDKLLATVMHK